MPRRLRMRVSQLRGVRGETTSDIDVGVEGGEREAMVEFWGLKESSNLTDRRKRKVVLRVVDPSTLNTEYSSTTHQDLERQLELSLALPDDLPSYVDGQPVLSAEQIREGCEFIARHLSSPSSSNARRKVHILTHVARPEDGMAIALCYLAYFQPTSLSSSTLLESLHYFRDPSDSDTDIAFSLNTDADADVDLEERIRPWYESLSPAHLLYMRLLDEVEPRSEVRDPRGRETSRSGSEEMDIDVDVVGDPDGDKEAAEREEEYAGMRTEWRGVLSFEGLMRVDEARRGRDVDVDHGDVEVNGEEED
ncbi:hypothetical protein CVT26_015437 [Gymnopilus dilepis]|uniref:Uncharacterized protein n=1 Tax=Gymnopilus dilepis TaxID=231916 RepID=A0A409YEM5_9AGAR|nr:hypothetical protein CVT26_015437 [Gymnopilus dilepis]